MKKRKHGPNQSDRIRHSPRSESRSGEWLYGTHAALEALKNPKRRIHVILATAKTMGLVPSGFAAQTRIVEAREIDALLPRDAVHQGLAVQTDPLPQASFAEILMGEQACLLIALDQVTDPHNVGAILRSACAFGASALIVTERHAPAAGGVLAKAASGALEHVAIVQVVNLARTLDEAKEAGYFVIGLAEEGSADLAQLPVPARTLLVLGSEGEGLRRLTRERCDQLARLATAGPIASLNVSNAAAVALYALSRAQRRK